MEVEKNNVVYIISSDENCRVGDIRIAIVINLYYEETLDLYFQYINKLSDKIDIYIFSSNERTEEKIAAEYVEYRNICVKRKLNRGRDVSALLVAFKPYLDQYEYVCFLHDKKAKHGYLKKDLDFWNENLWGNMIFSNGYIYNAIQLMNNENYGILLPPKPIGQYMDSMYIGAWNDDFDNVKKLADELQLDVAITEADTSLVAIGSAFWCKVKALKKLFDYNWTYESFVDEPMPDDGTISHAIERILGFVVVDAGYRVGTIMNQEYATKLIAILQDKMELTYDWLWNNLGVKNTYQLEKFNGELEVVSCMFKKHREIYLYGAGLYGRKYLQRLEYWGYQVDGFIVSDGMKTQNEYCGYSVYELREVLQDKDDFGIIITTNPDLQNVIANLLEDKGIVEYYKAIVV